jgi:alkylation response protein AidB-like acyl-CoA dehydrogenase
MLNHSTNVLFFDNVEIPADSLIGEEGKGFAYILDGMNAERILVASESVGDGRWFIEKAVQYSKDRVIFGKAIGANQGVQFPIAKAHMSVEAADLMRLKAAAMFDAGPRRIWPNTSVLKQPGRQPMPVSIATAATVLPPSTTSSENSVKRVCTRQRPSIIIWCWRTLDSMCWACHGRTETSSLEKES